MRRTGGAPFRQPGHCQPTGALTMQSVQMGRSHRVQLTGAATFGWR